MSTANTNGTFVITRTARLVGNCPVCKKEGQYILLTGDIALCGTCHNEVERVPLPPPLPPIIASMVRSLLQKSGFQIVSQVKVGPIRGQTGYNNNYTANSVFSILFNVNREGRDYCCKLEWQRGSDGCQSRQQWLDSRKRSEHLYRHEKDKLHIPDYVKNAVSFLDDKAKGEGFVCYGGQIEPENQTSHYRFENLVTAAEEPCFLLQIRLQFTWRGDSNYQFRQAAVSALKNSHALKEQVFTLYGGEEAIKNLTVRDVRESLDIVFEWLRCAEDSFAMNEWETCVGNCQMVDISLQRLLKHKLRDQENAVDQQLKAFADAERHNVQMRYSSLCETSLMNTINNASQLKQYWDLGQQALEYGEAQYKLGNWMNAKAQFGEAERYLNEIFVSLASIHTKIVV